MTVAQLAARVGLVFQDPDRQIFAGSVRGRGRVRAAQPRPLAAMTLQRVVERRSMRPAWPARSARTPTTSAARAASSSPSPRSSRWARRSSSSTSRRPARTRGAWSACARIVESVAAAGRTVIAISHDMRFVAETFERVVVMRAGRVILDGPPASVFAEQSWEALRSTYLEPPLAARVGQRLGLGSTPTDAGLIDALRLATARRGPAALVEAGRWRAGGCPRRRRALRPPGRRDARARRSGRGSAAPSPSAGPRPAGH